MTGTSAAALIPPGISSPASFRLRAVPSQAPLLVTAPDSGSGTEGAVARPLLTVRWSAAGKLDRSGGTMGA